VSEVQGAIVPAKGRIDQAHFFLEFCDAALNVAGCLCLKAGQQHKS
jgi:hypothetical protein